MDTKMLSILQMAADSLFKYHKHSSSEFEYTKSYLEDDSILNSGWDYHWVCSNVAGCLSQLENTGKIEDFGCIPHLGSFQFLSSDVLETYFPKPEKCPLFIANLFIQQQALDICLNHFVSST